MRFYDHGKRRVLAAFGRNARRRRDGGDITSDAGGVLLRETAERLDLFPRMATCFEDRRKQDQVLHKLPNLLAQRVVGIALGYEDVTDHDSLRHDPLMKLLGEPDAKRNEPPQSLAGSSTPGRVERSFQKNNRRYHKITAQPNRLQDLYVDLFTESHDRPPERITLDIDATDVETHGHQAGGFFHGYYEHRCYFPEQSLRPRLKSIISSDNMELHWNGVRMKNYSVFFAVSASQRRAPLASAQTSPLLRT